MHGVIGVIVVSRDPSVPSLSLCCPIAVDRIPRLYQSLINI